MENVPRDCQAVFFVAQHALESVPLPQLHTERSLVVEPGVLLRVLDESETVRIFGDAFNEQVDVIRHEAVRKNRKALLDGSASKLRAYQINAIESLEGAMALECAERQEISMQPEIIEGREMFGPTGEHAGRRAKRVPRSA